MRASEKNIIVIDAVIILFFSFLLLTTVTLVAGEEMGVSTSADITYELLDDDNIVHVTKVVTLTNADENTRYWQGYYDSHNYYVPDVAENIISYDNSGDIEHIRGAGEYHIFSFNERVWHGDVYQFTVEYDIPVNQNTAVFSVWDNSDIATAKIIIPDEYELSTNKKNYVITHLDDLNILDPGYLGMDVGSITVNCVKHTEFNVLSDTLELRDRNIVVTVKYWDGEEQWAEHVMDVTSSSLLMLEDSWGIAYPAGYDILIIQSSIEDTGGYGGLNNWSKGIMLLHTSKDITLVHELVHYWTESCSFEQLWMDEGYANFYALMILEELDPVQAEKERKKLADIPSAENFADTLTDWSVPTELTPGHAYQTKMNYKRAFLLTSSIYEAVGDENFNAANSIFTNSRTVSNIDHIGTMEQLSEKELDSIYDQYL